MVDIGFVDRRLRKQRNNLQLKPLQNSSQLAQFFPSSGEGCYGSCRQVPWPPSPHALSGVQDLLCESLPATTPHQDKQWQNPMHIGVTDVVYNSQQGGGCKPRRQTHEQRHKADPNRNKYMTRRRFPSTMLFIVRWRQATLLVVLQFWFGGARMMSSFFQRMR